MRQSTAQKAIVHGLSLLLVFVMIFPVYIMILGSFKPGREIFNFKILPNPETLTLDGYRTLFQDFGFFRSCWNTFFTSTVTMVFGLLFASMAGYVLAKLQFPFRRGLFFFIISTMMVPFSLLMLPLFVITRQMKLINTLWGIIIPGLPRAYGVFLIRQFMRSIPKDLIESARIDGYSFGRIFTKIALPLSKPILLTLATTMFLSCWNNYTWPLIAVQNKNLRVLQVHVAGFFQEHITKWDLIFSSLCLSTIPTIILFFAAQKFLVEGIKLSGIKE
jgi:multiple sugar transport system permease protein